MTYISPEDLILIEAGNPFKTNAEKLLKILKRWKDSINWEYLLENAENNYIIPQVFYLFKEIDKSYIPSQVLGKLEEVYFKSVIRFLQTRSTIREIFHILKEQRFMLMKGSVIAQYYPEQQIRSSIDVDILVHDLKDFKNACKKLINAGYKLHPPPKLRLEQIKHFIFTKKNRIVIELHKDTQWAHFRASMNKNEIFESALVSKIENREFLVVSPENNILLICTRLLEDGFF